MVARSRRGSFVNAGNLGNRIFGLVRRNKITTAILLGVGLLLLPNRDAVEISLPNSQATVRVGRDGDDYYVSVKTPFGAFDKWMWEDWGPAQRTGLYLTSEGWIAALGAGGVATFIAVPEGREPTEVDSVEAKRTDSSKWRYLGAVDRDYGTRSLRFFGPSDQPECFDTLGAGESPYRSLAQWETACDCVQRAAMSEEVCNMSSIPDSSP